jgi:predicted nucleic acid-binding protein
MTNKLTKAIYCDSCVFVSYLEETPDRIATIDNLFDTIRDGKTDRLITSTLTITEVAFAAQEKENRKHDPNVLGYMDTLWTDLSLIMIIEFNEFIARMARNLMRQAMLEGLKLTTIDAIHLATIQWVNRNGIEVPYMFTYDDFLLKN